MICHPVHQRDSISVSAWTLLKRALEITIFCCFQTVYPFVKNHSCKTLDQFLNPFVKNSLRTLD